MTDGKGAKPGELPWTRLRRRQDLTYMHIRLPASILAVLVLLFASSLGVQAQSPTLPRVAYVGLSSGERSPFLEAFRQGLRERGWREGQNVLLEDRSVREYGQLAGAIADLVRTKVDVLVTNGGTATQIARKATASIPIVTVFASDPVQAGVAMSIGRPGWNVTGLTTSGQALVAKRLELLKEVFPDLRRVAVLWNSESSVEWSSLEKTEAAAKLLGLDVERVDVRRIEELPEAFAAISAANTRAVAPVSSTLFLTYRAKLAALATTHHLASTFPEEEYVEAGGLMSYGADRKEAYRQLAVYVDKILRGVKPGDLAFEQPHKIDFVINRKTAAALGFVLPQPILLRANRVIE